MMTQHVAQISGLELYREGEKAPSNGTYVLVNEDGDQLDYDPVILDAGELFPALPLEENIYFLLNEPTRESLHEDEDDSSSTGNEIPGTEGRVPPPEDLI